jgi:hypothetical protein
VDVTSLARPDQVPTVEPILGVEQNLTAGRDVCGDAADAQTGDVWTVQGQRWRPGVPQPVANGLEATLTGVDSVTLDVRRMGLDPAKPIQVRVTTDGPARIRLAGRCVVHVAVPAGTTTRSVAPGCR